MKNWKYIEGAKTGNANTGDFTNLINRALRVAREKPEKANRMNEIIKFLKSAFHLPSERWQYHIDRLDKEISSAEKQKTGNADLKSYSEVLEKAKRELEKVKEKEKMADSIKSKEEWASARREIEDKIKYYQSRIGNENKTGNTAHSDKVEVIKRLLHANWSVQEIYELLKKEGYEVDKNFIERMKTGNEDKTGAEEFFKQLSDDVKEREDKDDADIEKVGNANLETSVEKGKLGLWNWYVHKDGTIVSGGTSSTEANAKEMARKALEKEKVGNFKTGKSALKPGDRVQSYGVQGTVRKVEGENSDNIYGEPIIEVEWDNGTVKKVGEHYLRKIGNKVGNSKLELPDGSTATVEDDGTIKIKKPRDSSIYITKLWDKERAEKQLSQKGAKKVGNSAPDDKFAYVMREFDEGKLKTPDGKVVTDPAQAKAIAYSESKKTENGLARARNAMAGNKKAIGSYFNMNNYGIEVGQWSWDWKNGAPDKKTMDDTARKIKDYVRQIDKNVPDGDNDERDEVFAKLDRFMHSQGLK